MFEGWFQSSEAESSSQTSSSSKKEEQSIPGLLRRSSFMARDGVITEKEKEKIKYALLGSNRVNRAKIGKGIVSYEQDKGLAELQNALSQLNSPSESTRGGVPSTPMVEMMRGMEMKEAMGNGSSSSSSMMMKTESEEDAGKKKRPRSISLKQALSNAQKDTKKYHRRKPRRWKKEEDDALRAAVKKVRKMSQFHCSSFSHGSHTLTLQHGGKNWKAIAVDVRSVRARERIFTFIRVRK